MSAVALIATRKGLFKLTEHQTIEPVGFSGVPVTMMLASKHHARWYAALDHGHFGTKFYASDDEGVHWQELTAPAYPKQDDKEDGDSLKMIWSLEFAKGESSNELWAGTIPGGLFYSNDGGNSWQLNQTLWQYKQQQQWFGGGFDEAGIHSICVDPEDSNKVSIAVSCAGVWVTENGGESWNNQSKGMRAEYMPPEQAGDPLIQDPHRMVQCPSDPEQFWVQHHNGIFVSSDGTKSWQEIESVEPSAFGFATVVHPDDGNTAWFVPAVKDECRIPVDGQFVVTRTRDGGKTFEQLNKGLPLGLSYDLVFRHGLDIDATGDQLLMGSTTGNLWLSDNQGDSWQCLSNHLPPIYAVRFIK